jgi:hypothetical protein
METVDFFPSRERKSQNFIKIIRIILECLLWIRFNQLVFFRWIYYFGHKYFVLSSCCCDPKVIETARSGIIFSTLVSVVSTIMIIGIIFYKGWDFQTLHLWKTSSIYAGFGALIISIFSYFLMDVRDFFLFLFSFFWIFMI